MDRDEISVRVFAALIGIGGANGGMPRPTDRMRDVRGHSLEETVADALAEAAYVFADALIARGSK